MNNEDLPKCDCGIAVGLSAHDDRWWCPACLWKEIERLREAMVALLEDAEDMRLYADDWTWKYGTGWDKTLAKAREVLAAELEPEGGDS